MDWITLPSIGGNAKILLTGAGAGWSTYNPSISRNPSGDTLMTVRSAREFANGYHNKLYVCEVDPDKLEVSNLRQVSLNENSLPDGVTVSRGLEDARLFWRDGGWQFIAVLYAPEVFKYSTLGVLSLDTINNTASLIKILESPYGDRPEKNWSPPDVATDKFDFNYSPQKVYKSGKLLGDERPVDMRTIISGGEYLSGVRGGTQLVLQEDGTYLSIVHSVGVKEAPAVYNPNTRKVEPLHTRIYRHYFAKYSEDGFLTHLSDPWIFRKNPPRLTNQWFIEHAEGMIEHRDDLIISFGAKDKWAGLASIPKANVIPMLKPVDYSVSKV